MAYIFFFYILEKNVDHVKAYLTECSDFNP